MFKGIDVSVHNGSMDWAAAKADGVQFAIIRLGWGSDTPGQDDSTFEANVRGCEENGIPYGIYLYSYALTYDELYSEVDHALRLARECNPTLGIWFDMEDADGYKANHGSDPHDNPEMYNDFCNIFCQKMEEAGYATGTYCNEDYCRNVVTDLHYSLWLAVWGRTEPTRDCLIWQYTSDGIVDGNGASRMDMNYYYGDIDNVEPSTPSEDVSDEEINDLAHRVLNGEFGDGEDRRNALGSKFDRVQARVNELLADNNSEEDEAPAELSDEEINDLAQSVISGAFGDGDSRRAALGDNYDRVQARVNEILNNNEDSEPSEDDIDDLAHRVLNGEFGDGEDRRNALGDNYDRVQARVNEILEDDSDSLSDEEVDELARRAYRGEFGDGEDRRNALGDNYDRVQARVNELFG